MGLNPSPILGSAPSLGQEYLSLGYKDVGGTQLFYIYFNPQAMVGLHGSLQDGCVQKLDSINR
jgi:hypothetical protein